MSEAFVVGRISPNPDECFIRVIAKAVGDAALIKAVEKVPEPDDSDADESCAIEGWTPESAA